MIPCRTQTALPCALAQPNDPNAAAAINICPSYPYELHYMKALALKRQYRQCIQRAQDLLVSSDQAEPLHFVFLNFYIALSHDGLARSMHNRSVRKSAILELAEHHYVKARDALGLLQSADPDKTPDSTALVGSQAASHSVFSPPTPQNPRHDGGQVLRLAGRPSSHHWLHSPFVTSTPSSGCSDDKHTLHTETQTPTRVTRKLPWLACLPEQDEDDDASSAELIAPTHRQYATATFAPGEGSLETPTYRTCDDEARSAGGRQSAVTLSSDELSTPQSEGDIEPSGDTSSIIMTPSRHSVSDATLPSSPPVLQSPLQTSQSSTATLAAISTPPNAHASLENSQASDASLGQKIYAMYNAHLVAFCDQLQAHIDTTTHLLAEVLATQEQKVTRAASYWSFATSESQTGKMDRIKQGKERGWKRERFRPERYRELCEKALTELAG
ncbi:hypothetical protein LTR50_000529 [Elasticomyces elasticus]|nr:hypothetical protein LTR50_000510 [Elasticomyces elasticus]KAK4993305.1 hypothetical protein LTR50_000529 [Elasticomyces elasticus]